MTESHAAEEALDRRADERLREDWLEQALADPGTVFLVMRDGAALVRRSGADAVRLALLGREDPRIVAMARPGPGRDAMTARPDIARSAGAGAGPGPSRDAAVNPEGAVLLGWYRQRRCVLIEWPVPMPATAAEAVGRERGGGGGGGATGALGGAESVAGTQELFAELRPLVSELPAGESGLAAYARALHLWHAGHRFCSRCGAGTVPRRAGHARACTACGQTHFPRLDPAIIVLAHAGGQALLGRQASWAPGRFSTIAGFVEAGESLEQAVRRELREEAGVQVQQLRYHGSQPWPFPSSLMLGFTARATWGAPVLHDGELEEARWFTREELRSGAVKLPPPPTISRQLIDWWLQQATEA